MVAKNSLSFTSASAIPIKLFKDAELIASLNEKQKVLPRHVQISPTNRCNLNCPFCSCKDRDKKLELSKNDVDDLVDILVEAKTAAVTITGGGEPLLFTHFEYLTNKLRKANIDIGLTTNGILFNKIPAEVINFFTWVRISLSDYSVFDEFYMKNLNYAIKSGVDVDFGFSYVASETPDIEKIVKIITYAKNNNFTHIRLVNDILSNSKVDLNSVKIKLRDINVDDNFVIYQSRQETTRGNKCCLISLLKPMIAADGLIYPCCGIQYAQNNKLRDFQNDCSMGHFKDLPDLLNKQQYFDGSACDACYYDAYNIYLGLLVNSYTHLKFI